MSIATIASRVSDIMTPHVETLAPSEDLDLADMIMRLDRLRHLPVVDDEGRLVGMLSQRDVLRHQVHDPDGAVERTANLHVCVADVMTPEVFTTTPDASVLSALRTIRAERVGALPVVDNGDVVGIITETDLLALLERLLA